MSWFSVDEGECSSPGKSFPTKNNEGKAVSHESVSPVATAALTCLAASLVFYSKLYKEGDSSFLNRTNIAGAYTKIYLGSGRH